MAVRRLVGSQRSILPATGLRTRFVAAAASGEREMSRVLQEHNFPTEKASLFANRSAGQTLKTATGRSRGYSSSSRSLHGSTAWGMHKFGGASLADAGLYRTCGDILIAESAAGGSSTPTAAVVSAMKGMTDKLIGVVDVAKSEGEVAAKARLDEVVEGQVKVVYELLDGHKELADGIANNIKADAEDIAALLRSIQLLKVAPNSTMELVAGQGEIWSAQLLCAYLKIKGVPTAWLNAREILVVDSSSAEQSVGAKGAALDMRVEPLYEETATRLQSWWQSQADALAGDKPPVVVIAGFVCCTMEGVPTTLKRSGSDYSATIFGRLFKAAHVTLWKNVDGVFTADPGTCTGAQTVKEMSYKEAIELAYFGGQVIHPTAMIPSMADDTPVFVRNVFNPSFAGTKITREGSEGAEFSDDDENFESPIKFVTSIPNIALVDVSGGSWGSVSKVTRKAMGALEDAGVKVVLVTQACASHSLSLAVDESEGERAVEAIRSAFELELSRGQIDRIGQDGGYSIISVIGDGMKGYVGTLGKLAASLARVGVSLSAVAQGSSERNITFVVEKSKLKLGMQAVHEEFHGSTTSVSSSVEEVIFSTWKSDRKHLRV